MAKGTLSASSAISDGRVVVTKTFTSNDLFRTYGQSAITWSESYPLQQGVTKAGSSSMSTALFVMRQDETPNVSASSSGSSSSPNSIFDGNGFIYPQWTYIRSGGGCSGFFYVQSDPINFGYEFKPLNDIVNFLTGNKGWWDTSWCSNTEFIYDFTGYGWKAMDKTLRSGDCFGANTYHIRLFVMANGRVALGAHQEYWNGAGHTVTSFENGELKLWNDYNTWPYQYSVYYNHYWLNNALACCPDNDASATQAF